MCIVKLQGAIVVTLILVVVVVLFVLVLLEDVLIFYSYVLIRLWKHIRTGKCPFQPNWI